MKKLLSILLVLGMLLSLAPMALASEEAVADEPEIIAGEPVIEEDTIEAPALDGLAEITGAKITGDRLSWDAYPGTAEYQVMEFEPSNHNIAKATVPYINDLKAVMDDLHLSSGTYTFRIIAINGNGQLLAQAYVSGYEYTSELIPLELPVGHFSGTKYIWEPYDYAKYGLSSPDGLTLDFRLYAEHGNGLWINHWKITDFSITEIDLAGWATSAEEDYYLYIEVRADKSLGLIDARGYTPTTKGFAELAVISSAAVTGLDEPAAGQTGDTVVSVSSGAVYTVDSVAWWDYDVSTTAPLSGSWTFQEGHAYDCAIVLRAKVGYTFTDDTDVTVNGAAPYSYQVQGDGQSAMIVYRTALSPRTVQVTLDGNGGKIKGGGGLSFSIMLQTVTIGQPYGTLREATRDGYTFDGWFTESTGGTQVTADTVCTKTSSRTLYAHWTKNEEPETPVPETPTLTISSDAKKATITGDFTGLFARVALILDNNGVSGLYITQATINTDGTILIPEFMVPGLKVKGVNVSLVPTLADIQSSTPNVKATASKML